MALVQNESPQKQKEKQELQQLNMDVKIEINNPPPISSSETPVSIIKDD